VQRTERVKGVDLHPTEPWCVFGLRFGARGVLRVCAAACCARTPNNKHKQQTKKTNANRLLANLYNGNVYIWNYNDSTLAKSFEVTDLPVRAAKFVPRKQWVVAGADDMFVRVYNYNTMDKVRRSDGGGRVGVTVSLAGVRLPLSLFERLCLIQSVGAAAASGRLSHTTPTHYTRQTTTKIQTKVRTFEAHTDYIRSVAAHPTLPYLLTSSDDMLIKLWDWDKGWACMQVR
jgi:WD40 repeat protein